MTFLFPVDIGTPPIDMELLIEYTGNHMVNKLEITIKKRSG